MSIRVALHHETTYRYDRLVGLGPQIVRLRPAPHCRTKICSYSMRVIPEQHFCNWQQDPQGNYLARLVFPKQTRSLSIEVDLVAEMTAINPFDFFLEPYAESFPFRYEDWLLKELAPFLHTMHAGPRLKAWVASVDRSPKPTIQAITDLNRRLHGEIKYEIRMEPGVQTPEETLERQNGSCRDSAWLLVQIFRHLGVAARFASGYLIQLAPDVKAIDGPSGPDEDFTDLHAWAEIYLPGAGWVGLDPTSGLLCGEGHLPLACTPEPSSAAPISGTVDQAECEFHFSMALDRIQEDPRSTKPYSEEQWHRIDGLGRTVDQQLETDDARLTFGGEPTFVSMDDMQGEEWNQAAVGPTKRQLSGELIKRLRQRFGPGGLLHYGQGKWYPGESLPRWALTCLWRLDGEPIWQDDQWIADESRNYGFTFVQARSFTEKLASHLGVDPRWMMPAYEDIYYYIWREQRLPINVAPWDPKLEDPEERARLARVFQRGLNQPVGVVLPIQRQWWQGSRTWQSGPWPVRPERLFLLPGDSSIGLRLPLDTLPWTSVDGAGMVIPQDPFAMRPSLPSNAEIRQQFGARSSRPTGAVKQGQPSSMAISPDEIPDHLSSASRGSDAGSDGVVRTALCVEPRDGRIYVFMPPTELLEDYLELTAAIEWTAKELRMPVVLEGYLPPRDHRVQMIKVTPDPGVIEVNVHPSRSWKDLVANTQGLYEDARQCRLATEKFDLDGKHTGTGGGNHIVMGGPTPWDSPFLRRPDLLRSIISFWNNHPSLSYFFSNRFIGPTSQAPRADEGRRDAIYELQTALELIPDRGSDLAPWVVDRLLRNLLIDLTGNTHRTEICIDKLYSPDSSTGRLGLVELRGFEMPPHAQMSLVTQLLVRCLIACFWRNPYREPLVRWDTAIHDRFMLPHFLLRDLKSVLFHLQEDGWAWEENWFAPHYEFRFPFIGEVAYFGASICLRSAIEPWYVLGEEPGGGGTVRFVDSSVERVEVKVQGLDIERHKVLCNRRILPLQPTGDPDSYVAGVRYRAWWPPSCLHPTIPLHTPLVFDLWDVRAGRTLGGCTYHVAHPGGRNYETFPVNALEAEGRRVARFFPYGHTPGSLTPVIPRPNPEFPSTLDLRRES
ncbi:MAG: DUF2126 domain-containing protein [Planctomycetota bacterium]|jgi:uncharacterized protein (DUF2126 family)/transglutaminase-like putative cysteine protease